VWKYAPFIPAASSNPIFSSKARFVSKSSACAENIMRPVGTITTSDAMLQGSRKRASARTGICFARPSTRRSNIATEPTSAVNPSVWKICTVA
jgi:hypothetical protein